MSKYTNSPLVDYVKISPNRTSPRNHKIDTITIHCVVGQCTVETLGNVFAKDSRDASANYGVGYDGRIGMYCEEKDRSWCSSSAANDNRAVTIEVASDTFAPYAVTPAAYESLIKLVADICKRNDIERLIWKNDKTLIGQVKKQNMTAHKWLAPTACPGNYLFSRYGDIAKRVNALLGAESEPIPETPKVPEKEYEKEPVFMEGDEVKLVKGAKYANGKTIPIWLFNRKLYVRDFDKNENIIFSIYKTGKITGIVDSDNLQHYSQIIDSKTEDEFEPYLAKFTGKSLIIRKGPGKTYGITSYLKKGTYTIVEERTDDKNIKWGLLKSYASKRNGWVNLSYLKK